MLRFVCLGLLAVLAGPCAAQPDPPAAQHQQAAVAVWQDMAMDDLAPILRDEALAEAEDMARGMFPRGGTGHWLDRVRAINHPDRIRGLFLSGVSTALDGTEAEAIHVALAFYRSSLGRRVLDLEKSARIAMLDKDVELVARAAWSRASRQQTPRAVRIARLIDMADLIEPNVAGGLNASIAFARGFGRGGGFPMPPSDGQIVQDAWARETQMRMDISDWMGAYLLLAYSSLSDAELDAYTAFAGSAEGQALSRLMLAGFDAIFGQTSYDMGLAAAAEVRGRQL